MSVPKPSVPSAQAASPSVGLTAPSHVLALAARGVVRQFRPNLLLIQEGERGDSIYIITKGRLRVFAADSQGKEVTLAIHGPGEYVGEMALDGGLRSAHVETMETSTCAVISRDVLLAYIAEHPAFALEMMGKLIRRARLATESARSLALIDIYGRLAHLLGQLADPAAENGIRTLKERITHQQLASHLACSREMVSRLLKDLEKGGYIEKRNRRLVLLRRLPAKW